MTELIHEKWKIIPISIPLTVVYNLAYDTTLIFG